MKVENITNNSNTKGSDNTESSNNINSLINISLGRNIKNTALIVKEVYWQDLVKSLSTPQKEYVIFNDRELDANDNVVCNDGIVRQLSFEEAIAQSVRAQKKKLSYFVGGTFNKPIRNNTNLISRSLLVLDIDKYKANIEELDSMLDKEIGEYDYIAYSTTSYNKDNPSIRVVLRFEQEVKTSKYKQVAANFIDKLSFANEIDKVASTTPSQAMYLPAIIHVIEQPENMAQYVPEFWYKINNGKSVEVNDYLSNVIKIPRQKQPINNSYTNNILSNSLPVEQSEIAKYLKYYKASSLEYNDWLEVGMALHHHYNGSYAGLEFWKRWSADDNRYEEVINEDKWSSFGNCETPITFRSVIKKAHELDKHDWQQNVLEQIKQLRGDFNEERELMPILRGIAKYCSLTEAEYYLRQIKTFADLNLATSRMALRNVRRELAVEDAAAAKDKIFPLDTPLPPALFQGFVDDNTNLKTTIGNLKILIKHYGITIRRNVISREDEIEIPNCTFSEETKDEASFAMLISVSELNNLNKSQHMNSYSSTIASENSYNPVLDFILSKSWDGITRLQSIYDTISIEDGFNKELSILLLRKWLISLIAAASEENGIFSKGVLLFQSAQSTGKTTWFKSLIPKELAKYFKDGANLDPSDTDSVKTVISHWLVELGEIDSTLRKDMARLKAFVSSDKDIFRVKYGKKDTKFARRTIFCGTVNQKEVLKDRSGNVRFWTIAITKLLSTNHIDKQQLWVELYQIYKSGEKWWLSQEEEKVLEASNENFLETCPYEELVNQYLQPYSSNIDTCTESNVKSATQILMKMKAVSGVNINIDQRATRAIVNALNRLGFKRELGNKKRYYIEAL